MFENCLKISFNLKNVYIWNTRGGGVSANCLLGLNWVWTIKTHQSQAM